MHSMDVNLEDGSQTPFKGMLAFPKGQKALKISTTGSQEFPCTFGAEVPSFDRTKQLIAFQDDVYVLCPPTEVDDVLSAVERLWDPIY